MIRRLPAVDSAWLRMERPDNLMTITGVLRFAERLDVGRLRRVLAERLLRHDRFRMRLVAPGRSASRPRIELLDEVDLERHVRSVTLESPADEGRLQTFVSERMSTPLDFGRPLWQCHYVDGLAEGSALVVRLHHCIADGMALIQVLLQLADDGPATELAASLAPRRERRSVAGLAVRGAAVLARLCAMPRDPATPLRGALQPRKKAVWSAPIPLERIKALGRAVGGTVNDVLTAAVAGALRSWLEARGVPCDGLDLRVVVPVNLRGPDELHELGNRFGLVFLRLPVGRADPRERLGELKRRMDRLKGSPEPAVVYAALHALGALGSSWLEERVIRHLSAKASAVMTNVPGPRSPIRLCGAEVRELMFWVPQSGGVGLGISVLSYAGHVRIGVAADVARVPDPEAIVAAFTGELERGYR